MKQINTQEIIDSVESLKHLLGSKVQKILIAENGLGFKIFGSVQKVVIREARESKSIADVLADGTFSTDSSYIWFDLNPINPMLLCFDKFPNVIKLKKVAPMLLFLKAHMEGKRISEIRHIEEHGRVIEIEFGYDNPLKLEVRLFPHGANAIAQYNGKQISFNKIKEIKSFQKERHSVKKVARYEVCESESTGGVFNGTLERDSDEANKTDGTLSTSPNLSKIRTLDQITQEWLLEHSKDKPQAENLSTTREKQILKKQKALQKSQEHLIELKNDHWARVGEWLKENQTLQVPDEFLPYVDLKKSFSHNIQNSFQKAKKNREKILGTIQRIESIQAELSKLENSDIPSPQKLPPYKSEKTDNWKGYRLNLNSKIEAFVGKNAQENLNILRFAKSWDYWIHIKDYPGAHGIIKRPRNYKISTEDFETVARFIALKSKKSAHFLKPGDSFEVLIAECRYVRPIKGDKLGRVNYSNETVLLCKVP